MNTDCSICKTPFNPGSRFLEGHINNGVSHLFDSDCIRQWLDVASNCPICRADLELSDLIQVYNQRYLWYMHAIKFVNSQIIWGAKKVLPITVAVGAIIAISKIAPLSSAFMPDYLSGCFNGTKAVLTSGTSSVFLLYLSRVAGFDLAKDVNFIFYSSVLLAAVQIYYTAVEELSILTGVITGSALTAAIISVLGENIHEEGIFQIGPFSNDFTTSEYVLGQINHAAACLVGMIAAGKLGNYYTSDRGILVQGISSLTSGTLGAFSILLSSGLVEISLLGFWTLLRNSARAI